MLDLDAGKYALFIWPAYGITALVLGWMIVSSLASSRRWKREVERLEKAVASPERPVP